MTETAIVTGKHYRYEVVKVNGKTKDVKVGQVLLYRRSRGPKHAEMVVNFKTGKVYTFGMEYRGPCWVTADGKVHDKKPEGTTNG